MKRKGKIKRSWITFLDFISIISKTHNQTAVTGGIIFTPKKQKQ